jgi:hypothetical protein
MVGAAIAPATARLGVAAAKQSIALACRPRCVRIFSMTGNVAMKAMTFNSPPRFGQGYRSRCAPDRTVARHALVFDVQALETRDEMWLSHDVPTPAPARR